MNLLSSKSSIRLTRDTSQEVGRWKLPFEVSVPCRVIFRDTATTTNLLKLRATPSPINTSYLVELRGHPKKRCDDDFFLLDAAFSSKI